jgi:hypothetical protein
MKRIISLAVFCLSLVQLIAQSLPQGIAYQAVAVKDGPYSLAGQNPQAIYWSNKDIKVRFTIYEKYPGGSMQYSEFHATKTDDYGVFNLIIGQGIPISGDFTKIPWDLGTAHLQVEIDFDNNGTYKLTSLERFWSVPYAFVTRKISSTSTDSALNALNSKFNYLKNRDKDTVIGNEGGVSYKSLDSLNKVLLAKLAALKSSDKDTVIGNEWQKLTRNKDTIILSDGGGKFVLLDEDPKNELQLLTRIKDTVYLSQNGGKFVLNDDDPKNELQDLSISGDTLKLTKSNSKVLLKNSNNSSSTTSPYDSLSNTYVNHSIASRVYPIGSFNITSPISKPYFGINCFLDLGQKTIILPCYLFDSNKPNEIPFEVWEYDGLKKNIYKSKNINSNLNKNYLGFFANRTSDITDTSFIWGGNSNFIVYKPVSDTYKEYPPSGSINSAFFSKLTNNGNYWSKPLQNNQNKLLSLAKKGDTIVFVFTKSDTLDPYYYIYQYNCKSDKLMPLDSIALYDYTNVKIDYNYIYNTKQNAVSVWQNSINAVCFMGDFKYGSKSSNMETGIILTWKKSTKKYKPFQIGRSYIQHYVNFNNNVFFLSEFNNIVGKFDVSNQSFTNYLGNNSPGNYSVGIFENLNGSNSTTWMGFPVNALLSQKKLLFFQDAQHNYPSNSLEKFGTLFFQDLSIY